MSVPVEDIDLLELIFQAVVNHSAGLREQNTGPVEKQFVLLTSEPSSQCHFLRNFETVSLSFLGWL